MTGTPNTLLVFFSRSGENLWDGGRRTLEIGNTKRVAGMIAERIECDIFEITAADPYSDEFDSVDRRSAQELRNNARPAIAGELPDVGKYERIIVGSPVWHAELPMILRTFFDETNGLPGKDVYPFVTFTGGAGAALSEVAAACPKATVHQGLPVRGEDVDSAGEDVDAWVAVEFHGEEL